MRGLLDEFGDVHRKWYAAFGHRGPLYLLPEGAIKVLSARRPRGEPYISAPNAHAECEFRVFCDNLDA